MIAPFVVVMILGSMLPSIDFDVLEYHLEGPKEYYQAGRIAFLPHNVYTSMPFGVEMLHLAAMEVMGDWWWGGLAGQLLVALFAPAAAILIAATARARRLGPSRLDRGDRLPFDSVDLSPGGDRLRRRPALFLSRGPGVGRASAACGIARSRGRSIWCLIGLLAGCAMGCKYPALISAVIPFGALVARRLQAESILRTGALLHRGLGDRDGALAGQERDRYRQPGLSARQFHLPRPPLGPGPRSEVVRRARAHGPSRAPELVDSLVDVARPVRLAIAAVCGVGTAGVSCVPVSRRACTWLSGDLWPTCSPRGGC